MTSTPITVRDVVAATPLELADQLVALPQDCGLALYARARLLYLQGRGDDLEALIAPIAANAGATDEHWRPALVLSQLRLRIRRAKPFEDLMPALAPLRSDDSPWQGETLVLLAMGYETLQRDEQARRFYQRAFESFHRDGLAGKAATALHNLVATESRLYPDRRFIYEFEHAHQYAKRAGEMATAGSALTNLSREYQKVGALHAALRTANQAIALLGETHFGSYQYYQGVCHRCHLYLELGQIADARADYEEASLSELPEIRYALRVLGDVFAAANVPKPTGDEPASGVPSGLWQDRRAEDAAAAEAGKLLSETENRLVEFLAEAPRAKHEILDYLYGDRTNYFDRENRLKQALHRLRRKRPDLVEFKDGAYRLINTLGGRPLGNRAASR